MDLTRIAGFALRGLSVFLILDAALAAVFGKRYILWCLKYMPAWYARFITKLYEGQKAILWIFILGEFLIGLGLFWLARLMVTTYLPL